MRKGFFESVLISSSGKTAAQGRLCARVAFNLFVQNNDESVTAGTAILSEGGVDGDGGLRRALPNRDLFCTDDSDQTVIGSGKSLLDARVLSILTLSFQETKSRKR